MSKDNDKDWDFDPSNEEEFVKNIEKALREEVEHEKINTDYNGGIQVIDVTDSVEEEIATPDESEKIPQVEINYRELTSDELKDELQNQDDVEDMSVYNEEFVEEDFDSSVDEVTATKEKSSQDIVNQNDEFAMLEEAVHRVAETKIKEDIESIRINEEEDEAIVDDITKSLAKQGEDSLPLKTIDNEQEKEKKKMALWKKILIPTGCVLLTLILFFVFVRYTKPGQDLAIKVGAWFASGRSNYDDGSNQVEQEVPDEIEEDINVPEYEVMDPEDVELNADEGTARHEEYATNILLLGEEAIDSGMARGRTDVMIIVTLNKKEHSIKMTSLMRDMYVQIPGHLDNKLNSAYATGGIQLLYDTIELNFDIKLDGYALVGFTDFEKIVDLLGGVDIEVTQTEANWLNTTNYISNPIYRTIEAGMNHMNGNQALGYCRIRSVGTADRETDDFGRTSRHRVVLDALFNKYKTLGLWDLVGIANSCLPMVTTDLDAGEIEDCIRDAIDIGLAKIEQNRIPADNTFENATIRKMSVIVPDLKKNVEILHTFVFGVQE